MEKDEKDGQESKTGEAKRPRKLTGIRKHQKFMMDFMRSKGYEVQFEREIYNHPLSSSGILKNPDRLLIGYTKAKVYLITMLDEWRAKENRLWGDKPLPLREATVYCSASEPFVKRNGNIRATAKVMNAMGLTPAFAAPLRAGKKLAQLAARERKKAREAAKKAAAEQRK